MRPSAVQKHDLGRTICASCQVGKLVSRLIWGGEAVLWYCPQCGHHNRWNRNKDYRGPELDSTNCQV